MSTFVPQIVADQHALVATKLAQLRAVETDTPAFRQLTHEIALLLLAAATADLPTTPCSVQTPLAPAQGVQLTDTIVIVPILRAGLGMLPAATTLLPNAVVWHLGIKRNEATAEPHLYYANRPEHHNASLAIVVDPMLATGGSAIFACDTLKSWGIARIKFVGIIAATYGLNQLQEAHPDIQIYVGQCDTTLNDRAYIVPGLGDAGDRLFGTY